MVHHSFTCMTLILGTRCIGSIHWEKPATGWPTLFKQR
jgi:hypothetical protein